MNITDIYGIIIENLSKEGADSMINNLQSTKWEIPRYSNSQVEKTGKFIAKNDDFLKNKQCMDILNNWRSAHAYPLHIITKNLRKNNKNAIIVQRLKRLDSIVNKLKRNPTMNLAKMQDLGGCRIIVDNIQEVYQVIEKYKNSKIKHILKKEDDYIPMSLS